jgi:DNA-directed RNA polymerase beta subunit
LIKKKTIEYIKNKLKIKNDFIITQDIVRDGIFCVPMYTTKLYKLTRHIVSSRDFGGVKEITGQPTRGRALKGGSRLGQMEIEGLLAHGTDIAVKEFLTVKSDHSIEKRKMLKELITDGTYNMTPDLESVGRTKKVVETILTFLKE